MSQLLGFAVLTGPLWLILILLAVGVWLAAKAAKFFQRRAAKIVVGVIVFLLIVFVPFGDEAASKAYLIYLCDNKAEARVYQTVELPKEYWDEQGRPRYVTALGVDLKFLPKRFGWHFIREPYLNSVIKIERWHSQLIDTETKDVLGEKITYMRHFGWMSRFSPAPNIGEDCRNLGYQDTRDEYRRKEREREEIFFRSIFTPMRITG
jgi:hypothetical protein